MGLDYEVDTRVIEGNTLYDILIIPDKTFEELGRLVLKSQEMQTAIKSYDTARQENNSENIITALNNISDVLNNKCF